MTDIVEIRLGRVAKLLADRKIGLELDGKALQWLANRGYPVYGARRGGFDGPCNVRRTS